MNMAWSVSRRLGVLMVLSAAAMPPAVHAQGAPAPAQPPTAQPAPPTAAPATAPQTEPYTYSPEGRRDPFVSLVSRGVDAVASGRRGEGLAGLTTAEIVVRGVMQSQGSYVAMVQGPDMKTYIVRVKDRLSDGTVSSITPQGLVIVQEVNDPLSLIKQREVRKGLRASEDAK